VEVLLVVQSASTFCRNLVGAGEGAIFLLPWVSKICWTLKQAASVNMSETLQSFLEASCREAIVKDRQTDFCRLCFPSHPAITRVLRGMLLVRLGTRLFDHPAQRSCIPPRNPSKNKDSSSCSGTTATQSFVVARMVALFHQDDNILLVPLDPNRHVL
jgi:hypothetical protein